MPRLFGTLSIVALLLFVAVLYALKPQPLVAADLIFPVLTILFITSSSIVVTYVAVKAYLREGLLSVLFLGCGVLVFGSTALLASLLLASEGQNFSASVLASGAVVSGAFHLLCASMTSLGGAPKSRGGRQAFLWLALASLSVVLTLSAALGGVLPPFYVAGTGTSGLDRLALGVAAVAFGGSASIIFAVFASTRSAVLQWYSLALAATALGLVGVIVSNGDMSALSMRAGWATMYLGGVLLASSVLSAERLSALSPGKRDDAA